MATPEQPAASMDRVSALGHAADAVIFDGEAWKIICSCSWECWDQPTDEHAWELFNDHVYDDVGTSLTRLRHNAKVVTL